MYIMPSKPKDILSPTVHTYWESKQGLTCPLCSHHLQHEFNDGGSRVMTLKGSLWVVTNYYSCTNSKCELHSAFPAAYHSAMNRKRFSLDIWAKVVQHYFKHHLNYSTIVELMWDDWEVSISRGTVRNICQFFEMAGKQYQDERVLKKMQEQGRIILSLDGAQPVKKEPSLWVFSDRLTGNVLLVRNLNSAPASTLCELLKEIEHLYGVPIAAVISDKQKNILNAVKLFNPSIPHAYCQYHFLSHIVEPIAAKDTRLKKELRKVVKTFSIMQNRHNPSPLYGIFSPICEELDCALSTKGDHFKVFPGYEAFLNLEHVLNQINHFQTFHLSKQVKRSVVTLINSLRVLLTQNRPLFEDIAFLLPEFHQIRHILAKRNNKSAHVRKLVDKWVYKLQNRLKRRNLPFKPDEIKWKASAHDQSREEIWQEWIRLTTSYHEGLFVAYDDKEIDFTNNAKEQLFHETKHHFHSLLGRKNISKLFQDRAALHVQLMDIDFSQENISEILLACETPFIESERKSFHAQYATIQRTWKIREKDTGNISQFKANMLSLGAS